MDGIPNGLFDMPNYYGKASFFFAQYVLSQSTVVLCIQVNEKSCRLRMGAYRDGVKRKGDKIGMGV